MFVISFAADDKVAVAAPDMALLKVRFSTGFYHTNTIVAIPKQ